MIAFSVPAFADSAAGNSAANAAGNKGTVTAGDHTGFATDTEVRDNLGIGGRNIGGAWVDGMDAIHEETAKGKNMPEHMTGLVAGTAIGTRRVIHRMGAGLIDVLTFWIPKKKPLIEPEQPRMQ